MENGIIQAAIDANNAVLKEHKLQLNVTEREALVKVIRKLTVLRNQGAR